MQLRAYPLINSASASNWPPIWTQLAPGGNALRDEVGVLKNAFQSDPSEGKCYLIMELENKSYVASLIFDDVVFCRLIVALFRERIGRSIKELGDLDLSFTLR